MDNGVGDEGDRAADDDGDNGVGATDNDVDGDGATDDNSNSNCATDDYDDDDDDGDDSNDGAEMLGHQKRLPSEEEEGRASHPPGEMRSVPKGAHNKRKRVVRNRGLR